MKRLTRTDDRIIGGVCGGLGKYFNIDPTFLRIIWTVAILGYGIGLFLYLLMWIITPEE